MQSWVLSILFIFTFAQYTQAQDFVTRGKIEYEIKRNNKKMFSAQDNGDNSFITSLPEFDISYRELVFSFNQSIYRPSVKTNNASIFKSESSVFLDLGNQLSVQKSNFLGEEYILKDSIQPIQWKLEDETRKIAGWECRKAVGRIYDSVYVVAFYCMEIVPQGGPELFTGLPGMILGLAIPRYYTTWFATKLEIANIDESVILPPSGKKTKPYTKTELAAILVKKYKENGWMKDPTIDKVIKTISGYLLN